MKEHKEREVAFPLIKSFSELFDVCELAPLGRTSIPPLVLEREDWRLRRKQKKPSKVKVQVGPYCSIHRGGLYRHVYVHPCDPVAAYLRRNWLGDSPGSYQVTVRNDGTALITAEYSRIIGSHWLALVDAASVPEGGS
jgi:hypothetical protein